MAGRADATMTLDERRLAVSELKVGMYVCRLDRPWEGTPFLLQGVMIESEDDIRTLEGLCAHVFVDVERGVAPVGPSLQLLDAASPKPAATLRNAVKRWCCATITWTT